MCGRFALYSDKASVVSHFKLKSGFHLEPRFNISPTQTIPFILKGGQLDFCRWGLLAPWAKAEALVGHINARWETLSQKPTFKQAFQKQRCLIPASGYFEWKVVSGKKQPYFIQVKTHPLMAFAGIWTWPDSAQMPSCAIITMPAFGDLVSVHPRMPLIVCPSQYTPWLTPAQYTGTLQTLAISAQHSDFEIQAVSARMNHPAVEGHACIRALS